MAKDLISELQELSPEHKELFRAMVRKGATNLSGIRPERRRGATESPLSYAQERIWSVGKLSPESAVDNVPFALEVRGRFDVSQFSAAVAELTRRHEILRSVCAMNGDAEIQRVDPLGNRPLVEFIDLIDSRDTNAVVRSHASETSARSFDLNHRWPLRGCVYRLQEDHHVILLVVHQFAADGLTVRILLEELSALYSGIRLDDPPIQYGDYAVWQRSMLEIGSYDKQIEYWTDELKKVPVNISLPYRSSPTGVQDFDAAYERLEIPADVADAVRTISRDCGGTVFMTLLAGFQVLLHLMSGQKVVVVGTLISSRNRLEFESLAGNFSNNLLLRADIASSDSFQNLLDRVKQTVLNAYENQDAPFQKLIERLGSTGRGVRPGFDLMFMVRGSTLEDHVAFRDAEVTEYPLSLGLTRLNLYADLVDTGSGPISGKLEYKSRLFSQETAKLIADEFVRQVSYFAVDPGRRLSDFSPSPQLATGGGLSSVTDGLSDFEPARTEAEARMCSLWERVVGIRPVGRSSNFFDLGGQSLVAIELFGEIKKEFSIDLPIATIYECPTVAALVTRIGDPDSKTKWLVPIQPYGSSTPLFVVHGYGGGVFYFRSIAEQIGNDHPVYGLQSSALDGEGVMESSVEEIAANYVEEILRTEPAGPYHIASHCIGGFIAFEIARNLIDRGKEVANLVLMDLVAPSVRDQYLEERAQERGSAPFRYRLRSVLHKEGIASAISWTPKAIATGLGHRYQRVRAAAHLALAKLFVAANQKVPPVVRETYIKESYHQILMAYAPQTLDVEIVLVRGVESSRRVSRTDLGWGEFASRGVQVVDLDVLHSDMIKESVVTPRLLGDLFTEILDRSR